jgi:hypothetical protein
MKSAGTNTVVLDTAGDSYFNGGNVGVGTTNPAGAKLTVHTGSGYGLRLQDGSSHYFRVAHGGNTEIAGKVTASNGAYIGDDDVYQDAGDNFYGGLVFETPVYKEYQYRWSGQNDHETNVYVPSYFMSEIVFTQHQTNGGTDINRHFVGKFANNHVHHELETIHDSGDTWSMTTTMTATDQNLIATGGSGSAANGRLRIVETYGGSGSYNSSTLTIRVYFGTISNITHTYG